MQSAPLPDMTSGIISVWFRDTRKNPAPPPVDWPTASVWQQGTSSMLPPNVLAMTKQEANKQNIFFWNSYGRYVTGGGITLPVLQAPSVIIPNPPPFVANGMHMILTFGDPNQNYDYYPWLQQNADVIDGV